MARRSEPEGKGGTSGFTLLEIVLVLFLAGLLAALTLPRLSGSLESARLRAGAGDVRATLTLARALSAAGARVRTVTFVPDRGEYGVDGEKRRMRLPEGVAVAGIRVGTSRPQGESVSVRFFPDGSADDAEIVLRSAGGSGSLRVTLDPVTGLAEAGT